MLKTLALETFFNPSLFKSKSPALQKNEVNKARVWLTIGLIGLNLLLLGAYIYGVNDYASNGYEIQSLKKKLTRLSDENKKIAMKVSEANSMVVIQTDFLNANFVAAGTPKFLFINDIASNRLTQR